MTDKLREAADQAVMVLERLDEWLKIRSGGTGLMPDELNTITVLRTALAEQPVEPVAIVTALSVHADGVVRASLNCELPLMMELYAAPQPAKQPLTDEQLIDLFNEACREKFNGLERYRYFARAIERAHGIGEQE